MRQPGWVIALLGMHSRGGIAHFTIEAAREAVHGTIVRGVRTLTDAKATRAQMQREVDRSLKIARIRQGEIKGTQKVTWVALLNNGAPPPKTLDELNFVNFKKAINTDVRLGVCGGILQIVGLTKLSSDYVKAITGDKEENGWRYSAGLMATFGTFAEAAGVAIENAMHAKLPWAQGLSTIRAGWLLRAGGRAFGLVGAAVMAYWDLLKVKDEGDKENTLTSRLYFASALSGFFAAIGLAFFASNPITWILVAIFIGAVIWLEKTKDNAIQGWLESCIFGISSSYKDGETEMRDLHRIFS